MKHNICISIRINTVPSQFWCCKVQECFVLWLNILVITIYDLIHISWLQLTVTEADEDAQYDDTMDLDEEKAM